MGEIKPNDPSLLTDEDVNYEPFSCCGDEDLVFLRCHWCHHIWVECFECSTWFVDLTNLDSRQHCFLTQEDQRLKCPSCERELEDSLYLKDDVCHKYLPTKAQVIQAGHRKFLAEHLQATPESQSRPLQPQPAETFWNWMGASCGASGWLIGAGLTAYGTGQGLTAAAIPLVAALLVVAVGYWLWSLARSGQRVRLVSAISILIAASTLFGGIALVVMHFLGYLEPIIDPDNKYPTWANFLVIPVLLCILAVAMSPPIKKRFNHLRL